MPRDPIGASLRAYQRLLRLYPPRFRAEFGEEMSRVFGDACRDGYRHGGTRSVAGVWMQTIPDVVVSVVDEHAEEDFAMVRSQLARGMTLGGFIAGALWIAYALLANMRPAGDMFSNRQADDLGPLLFASFPFLTAGLLAIYMRVSSRWPVYAKATQLLSIFGSLVLALPALFELLIRPGVIDDWFVVFIVGYFTMALGLLLTGLLLITRSSSQRYAVLLAGIAICCLFFNTEDTRVLFLAAAGILVIALSALVFQSAPNRQGEPPLSA